MPNDLQKYVERKMPLFNLIVSIWQHSLSLKNTIGVGFTKSIFIHKDGVCDLYASPEEVKNISNRILECIKKQEPSFKVWYKKAKRLNQEADKLLAQYQKNDIVLTGGSYERARKIFTENFGYCTVLPYWVLYGINQALERGESRETFRGVLKMYEELKGGTRYPQLVQVVIGKYFDKAAKELNISSKLASCIHPDELGEIIAGKNNLSIVELEKRMNWCAITRGKKAYKVNFIFDQNSFSKRVPSIIHRDVTEIKGKVSFKGIVRGRAKIVNAIDDMKKVENGDILISIQSSPSLMPAIIKCSAIVTDEGGIMCHASVISRELKKPCIIGTKIATKVLKDGDLVEVDANNGIIRIVK